MNKQVLMFHSPKQIKEFRDFYMDYAYNAALYWSNTERPDYIPEWWMSVNRNDISVRQLNMIPDLKSKQILDMGAAHICEEDMLKSLDIVENTVRIDIVGGFGGIGVIEMDACNTTFADESFDIVIAREIIEHVLDDRAMWREITRVLRPGGYLQLTTPNAYNLLPDGNQHRRGYSPIGLLNTAGNWGYYVLAKEGNVPNVFNTLLPLAMANQNVDILLEEFKQTAEIMKGQPWSYYVGSLMMLLLQKGDNEHPVGAA